MTKIFSALILAATSLSLLLGNAYAHGDEDHTQDNKKTEAKASASATITVIGSVASPQRLADGSLFIPKPIQRQLGLRTQITVISTLTGTVELNGKVIPDPDTGGVYKPHLPVACCLRLKGCLYSEEKSSKAKFWFICVRSAAQSSVAINKRNKLSWKLN
jgi:hypothetical protein